MKYIKLSFFIITSLLLCSCGTKRIPNQAVYLHDGQLNLLDGYYEIVPYETYYSPDHKGLDKLFDMSIPDRVTYIQLEFINDKKLKVSYEIAGVTEEIILKGKHKHGGFYLDKNWGALGIPPFIWLQWNNGKRILMGNDDNLILDEFDDKRTLFFGFTSNDAGRKIYLYDRLYQQFYRGQPSDTITNKD